MLADDVVIREATPEDAAGIARVYVETWHATHRGILPESYLEKITIAAQTRSWKRMIREKGDVVIVAANDDDLFGFGSACPERNLDPFFRGEIATLYVRPDAQ